MTCNSCLKVNKLPRCVDNDDEFTLEGLTFPDHADGEAVAIFKDMATGREVSLPFDIDVDGAPLLDLTEVYPLDDHPYEIRFIDIQGAPVNFVLTNPDDTTVTGYCCLEFETLPRDIIGMDSWDLSTTTCQA